MPNMDDFKQFDFSFDPSLDSFEDYEPQDMDEVPGADPGVFLPNTEGRSEFLPPIPERVPKIEQALKQDTPEYAARPALERTIELLGQMNPHRRVLLGVLRAAQDGPISNADIANIIDDLRAHKFSVYTPANICTMLQAAGALDKVREDGTSYADYEPKPAIIVIDGEQYYEPTEPPAIYWQTTEAGKEALEQDEPSKLLSEQLERDKGYETLYKRVLDLCARSQGATMSQLSKAVDSDPLIAEPRRFFVQHFVEALERCEAIRWQGEAWFTTETGNQALGDALAQIEDDYIPTDNSDKTIPTETQGINW